MYKRYPAHNMEYSIETVDPARPEQTITWNGHLKQLVQTQKTQIVLLETPTFGNVLFMDNSVQSSAYDQDLYHSALVKPALALALTQAQVQAQTQDASVIVLGGGEGCTSAKALEYGAKHVTQIDYDREAVVWAAERLVEWNKGVYADPRLHVIHDDAFDAVSRADSPLPGGKKADAIIVDLFDPDRTTVRDYTIAINMMMKNWLAPTGTITAYFGLWPNKSISLDAVRQVIEGAGTGHRMRAYAMYIPCFCAECVFLLISPADSPDVLPDGAKWVM